MAMNSKKVIVTGASGLLGRAVYSQFKKEAWDTLGLAFSRAKDGLVKVDLNCQDEVEKVLNDFQPNFLIHCAAERFPDKVERNYQESYNLNVECSRMLSKLAGEKDITFIFISTDYVFDGSNPPYKETDKPNPLNKYGQTKAEAEVAVEESNNNSCILRIPVLYGDEEYLGESAISSLLYNLLSTSVPRSVSDYEIRFPSHTDDIAAICYQMAEKKIQEPGMCGIYQWCGSEPFTKYGMTKVMAEVFSLPCSHISADPNPSSGALRPHNTQLCRGRLESLGIGQHTPLRAGFRRSYNKFIPQNQENSS